MTYYILMPKNTMLSIITDGGNKKMKDILLPLAGLKKPAKGREGGGSQ